MDENIQDVEILIEISQDMVEAHVTLISHTDKPEIDTAQISKALSDKRICYGIKNGVLAHIKNNDIQFNQKILIAAGEHPQEGENGRIEYAVDTAKTVKVKKGEKIGEIIPSKKGEEGVRFSIKSCFHPL